MELGISRRTLKISMLGLFALTTLSAIWIDRMVDVELARRATIARIKADGGCVQIDRDAGYYLFESENVVAIDLLAAAESTSDQSHLNRLFGGYDLAQFKKLSKLTIHDAQIETDEGLKLSGQIVIGPIPPGWFRQQMASNNGLHASCVGITTSRFMINRRYPVVPTVGKTARHVMHAGFRWYTIYNSTLHL